jgi:hypothetical protein
MVCIAVFAALFTVASSFLFSQTDQDPTPLLRAAIDKNHAADSGKTRFTYDLLEHSQNFNQKGKKIYEITRRYEVIYVADLIYLHLLEINGKPLAGQALADEQKRYDDAVRERTALDDAARAKLMHYKNKNIAFSFRKILTKYHSRVVETTQLNGRSCLLIDSTPLETVADAPKRHLRIWLDPHQNEFLRIDFDQLADEEDLLRGSSGSMSFTYIDGVLLDTQQHFDGTLLAKDKKKSSHRIVTDQTFSNYRRFVSTSRILPDEETSSPQ